MKLTTLLATLIALVALSPLAQADWVTIDFEDTAAWDDAVVTAQGTNGYDDDSFGKPETSGTLNYYYKNTHSPSRGVWFQSLDEFGDPIGLTSSSSPYLEAKGKDGSDIYQGEGQWDSDLDPNNNLDDFFLKTRFSADDFSGPLGLRLTFSDQPAYYLQGQVWDLEDNTNGYEAWDVTAYQTNGTVVDSISSGALLFDGKAWNWTVRSDDIAFDYVDITWDSDLANIRPTNLNIGMGFDNFAYTTSPVPEPATMALWGVLGMSGCGYFGLRRRKK